MTTHDLSSAEKPFDLPAPMLENPLPLVYVAQRVVEKICQGALRYQRNETGEALIGLITPATENTPPEICILDTIPPMEDVVRRSVMFVQGDGWQTNISEWWQENWKLYREMHGQGRSAKWDVPLRHLGDWHKQPGAMIAPSTEDLHTARLHLEAMGTDFLLAPIVTLAEFCEGIPPAENTLIVEAKSTTKAARIRIDFWWLRKEGRDFEPVKVVVRPNDYFPGLPPVVWWIKQRQRFDEELAALEKNGLEVMDVITWNTRGHPPLDTCLTIWRPGTSRVVIAMTPVNYPIRPPMWRVAPIMRPKEGQDLFETLLNASTKVPEGVIPQWTDEHLLVDGVKAIEAWEKTK